jgi:myo-inositol-1-phosphate synthase
MTHDGLGKYLSQVITKAPGPTADVVGILKERQVDLIVSYLPVGSEEATKWYVEQALRAGVGFINAIPVFIGREPYWQRRFAAEGLPIIGDDIKSQVGATITHRVLTRLFADRGVRIDRTYQLNFGGNTDFLNMLERERLESKKISKTNAVTSMLDDDLDADDIHVGPSDHVPWLKDRKWCHIRIEGTTFGDVPLNLELKLEVWDSPNSAGVITDAIRCLKLGLDRGLAGTLVAPSAYFMKSPPLQLHDDVARERVEAFIRGDDGETLTGAEGAAAPASTRRPRSRSRGEKQPVAR